VMVTRRTGSFLPRAKKRAMRRPKSARASGNRSRLNSRTLGHAEPFADRGAMFKIVQRTFLDSELPSACQYIGVAYHGYTQTTKSGIHPD
jgi:hypothetical protein